MTQQRWKDSLPELKEDGTLIDAAGVLVEALRHDGWGYTMHRDARAQFAATHIRAVRKQVEAEHGVTSDRLTDSEPNVTDEGLMWMALAYLGAAGTWQGDHAFVVDRLRRAEAALRTVWRRGQA